MFENLSERSRAGLWVLGAVMLLGAAGSFYAWGDLLLNGLDGKAVNVRDVHLLWVLGLGLGLGGYALMSENTDNKIKYGI